VISFTNFKTTCLAALLLFYLVLAFYLMWACKDDPSTLKVLPSLMGAALVICMFALIVFVNPMYRVYKRWTRL
jgi:hypothetical protein